MPRRWSVVDENKYKKELNLLYVKRNLSIGEISKMLNLADSSIYQRLLRLKIKPTPHLKKGYKNYKHIYLPKYSSNLAECVGILLGDGHLSDEQLWIILGNKEGQYVSYVSRLFKKVFNIEPHTCKREGIYNDLYIGSVKIVRYLKKMGLVNNKVKAQVAVPKWIFVNSKFKIGFLRGFFDTDGSAYKLKYGYQVSYCNKSRPLLEDSRKMLISLGFNPSYITTKNIYLTKINDLKRFLKIIHPAHIKKYSRIKNYLVG